MQITACCNLHCASRHAHTRMWCLKALGRIPYITMLNMCSAGNADYTVWKNLAVQQSLYSSDFTLIQGGNPSRQRPFVRKQATRSYVSHLHDPALHLCGNGFELESSFLFVRLNRRRSPASLYDLTVVSKTGELGAVDVMTGLSKA